MISEKMVESWARENGLTVLWPQDFGAKREKPPDLLELDSLASLYDFRESPCIDYGKFQLKIPRFCLRPNNQEQLLSCVNFLRENEIQYKVRAAGHSSGGQVLTELGAVLDCRHLTRVIKEDESSIAVEGGIWWLALFERLAAEGKRPVVMTDNPRTSVAGTLSVGGYGDTSHLYGPQTHSVERIKLLTPDGAFHDARPEDPLFQFALGGRGQLGVIAEVVLKTISRSAFMTVRLLRWNHLQDFVDDAIGLIENKAYEYLRARLRYGQESNHFVRALAGNFGDKIPDSNAIRFASQSPFERIDLLEVIRRNPADLWNHCSPAVEIVLPLPEGLRIWEKLNHKMIQGGLIPFLPRGYSVMILKSDRSLPLVPFPDSPTCMLIAIRPMMNLADVHRFLPLLRSLGRDALDAGGKLYLMSIDVEHPDFLRLQFGDALEPFRKLKQQVDPFAIQAC